MRLIVYSLFIALALTACAGSDYYQGSWKAINDQGEHSKIVFSKDTMMLGSDSLDMSAWKYRQNTVAIEMGVRRYGIQLENGLFYTIVFPLKDNQEKAVIYDQNGALVFTIGRSQFYQYEDIFGLQ